MDSLVFLCLVAMAASVLLVGLGFTCKILELRRLGLSLCIAASILWIAHLVYETPFDTVEKVGAIALVVLIALCADGFREERPWRKPLPEQVTYPVQSQTTPVVEEQVTEGR